MEGKLKNIIKFLLLFFISTQISCGLSDDISDGMSGAQESLRVQKMHTSLESMMAEENIKNVPNPSLMMPFGDAFASAATAEEIVKLHKVWLSDIIYGMPIDFDTSNPEHIINLTKNKTAKIVGLQIIAGLAPQETIDRLIQEQIEKGGRYQDIAYVVLMNRAAFIKKVLLEQDILTEKLYNKGKVELAIKHIESLESVFTSKHKAYIQLHLDVDAINFHIHENINEWNQDTVTNMWIHIEQSIEKELMADKNDPSVRRWTKKVKRKLGKID